MRSHFWFGIVLALTACNGGNLYQQGADSGIEDDTGDTDITDDTGDTGDTG
ncbi:MAG: hypothetical protein JRJ84_07725, partial [Deltaproteobacteria bacterium]|nr:hypothetical protein [Deltaproteobacteria bacterium]